MANEDKKRNLVDIKFLASTLVTYNIKQHSNSIDIKFLASTSMSYNCSSNVTSFSIYPSKSNSCKNTTTRVRSI